MFNKELLLVKKNQVLLILLVSLDLSFVILHITRGFFGFPQSNLFSIAREHGYAEFYQYYKAIAISFFLLALAIAKRELLFLSWAGMYTYIFLDDALAFHEKGGKVIGAFLPQNIWLGIQAKDIGEVLFSVAAFGFFGILIFAAFRNSKPVHQKASYPLVLFLFLLMFTGGFIDFIHSWIKVPVLWDILGLLEDGGEMIIMSVTTWYAYGLLTRLIPPTEARQDLYS